MPPRPYVDPAFAAALRALRVERGLSLRELAGRAYLAKSTISELENGAKRPSVETARHLDDALGGGGELAALVRPAARPDGEGRDRIAYALAHPVRLDAAAVGALARVLAAQRRADDAVPATLLIPAVEPQWAAVLGLARDARGPAAGALHEVAAEWTQFAGWLRAEARHDAAAVRLLDEAAEQAEAVGSGELLAQARNFRGYVERQRGNPRGIVRHFERAYRTPGAAILQRVGDAAQAAQGYALLGDSRTAARLLGEAADLVTRAEGDPPGTAYWLSPSFSRLNLGLAYLALGERDEAAQQLAGGLAGLPADRQAAEWAEEYRQALRAAEGG